VGSAVGVAAVGVAAGAGVAVGPSVGAGSGDPPPGDAIGVACVDAGTAGDLKSGVAVPQPITISPVRRTAVDLRIQRNRPGLRAYICPSKCRERASRCQLERQGASGRAADAIVGLGRGAG
jgi:hypothetical protein